MTSLYTAALNQRPPRPSPNDATGFLASSPLLPSTGLRRQSKAVPPNTPLLPPPPPPSEEATPPRAKPSPTRDWRKRLPKLPSSRCGSKRAPPSPAAPPPPPSLEASPVADARDRAPSRVRRVPAGTFQRKASAPRPAPAARLAPAVSFDSEEFMDDGRPSDDSWDHFIFMDEDTPCCSLESSPVWLTRTLEE